MAFIISEFRKKGLADGGSRPNLFSCQFTSTPGGLGSLSSTNFTFLCKIATIPPSTLGVVEVPYFGRMVKVPGNRTFDNLSITVINDEEMAIRKDLNNIKHVNEITSNNSGEIKLELNDLNTDRYESFKRDNQNVKNMIMEFFK